MYSVIQPAEDQLKGLIQEIKINLDTLEEQIKITQDKTATFKKVIDTQQEAANSQRRNADKRQGEADMWVLGFGAVST